MASRFLVFPALLIFLGFMQVAVSDDLEDLTSFLTGLWHNYQQVEDQISSGVPPEDQHSKLHATFFLVEVPIFIDAVSFYLEEYADENPNFVYRQRLYVFDAPNPQSKHIRNRLYSFNDPDSVLNGMENPEIFQNLTSEDLQYNEGCDLVWYRVSEEEFQNDGTGAECTTVIEERLIWIDVSNNLTSETLTISYQFIDVETGEIIFGWDSPFIMDKVSNSPQMKKPPRAIPPIKFSNKGIDDPAGQNFTTVLEAALSGYDLHYDIDLRNCRTLDDAPRQSNLQLIGGSLSDFEYFYGERFGPVPYIGLSNSDIVLTSQGHRLRLTQVRVYGNETVRVRIIQGHLNDSEEEEYDILFCDLWDGQEGDTKFFVHRVANKVQLNNFQEVLEALREGHQMRFVSHYYSCEPSPQETVGGGHMNVFDVDYEEEVIHFHTGSMIHNYFDGQGFLFNGASGHLYRETESVNLQPAGLVFGSWEVKYVSLYQCNINDGTFEGGFFFYKMT